MTTPETLPAAPPATRSNADYRWTVKKVAAFLRALAACGMVAQAARDVGMSRQAAYALKARLVHPQFQDMWATAVRTGRAARLAGRQAPSPWGKAGLAGLAYLRQGGAQADGTGGQADTTPAQADTGPAQADTTAPQADTLRGKVTF